MSELEFIGYIKGLGEIARIYAPFDKQLIALKEAGIKYPISVRDTAYIRLNNGPKEGTRTCHAPLYYQKSPVVLAMKSPLVTDLEMAKQAVDAHRNNKYFFTEDGSLYEKFHKIAEKDKSKSPEKRRAVIFPIRDTYRLQKGNNISETLFQDTEDDYFNEFVKNGLTFYLINKEIVDSQKGTLVNYLWFDSPDSESDLDGNGRILNYGSRAFGVSRSRGHAEGVAHEKLKKISNINLEKKVLGYSKRFVPDIAKKEFEKGLRKLLNK